MARRLRVGVVILGCILSTLASAAGPPRASLGQFEGQNDVGTSIRQGSGSYNAALSEYTLSGSGANMWGKEDAFHFVWRRWSGDVTLTANVKILTRGGNPHRKAGLIIRQGLGPADAYADAVVHGVGLTALQYRVKPGATTLEVRSPVMFPKTIRLERRGNTFTLFMAGADGKFTRAGSATVKLHDPVYIGLAVCAHDPDALVTADFGHVQVSRRAAAAEQ